jgi:hypothetical protein
MLAFGTKNQGQAHKDSHKDLRKQKKNVRDDPENKVANSFKNA